MNNNYLKTLSSVKIIRLILILILAIIIAVILITSGNILWFKAIINWLSMRIHIITGWDIQLARAISAFLTGLIIILPFGRLIWALSPIPMKSKVWYKSKNFYRVLVFTCISIVCLFTFVGSRNVNFNPINGKASKYYSIRPDGKCYTSSKPGFDPLTGDSLKIMTKEISVGIRGFWSKVLVKPSEDTNYFDHKTGQAIKFYSIRKDKYYISSESGFDPLTGDMLKPITKEIVARIEGLLPEIDTVIKNTSIEKKQVSNNNYPINFNYNPTKIVSATDKDVGENINQDLKVKSKDVITGSRGNIPYNKYSLSRKYVQSRSINDFPEKNHKAYRNFIRLSNRTNQYVTIFDSHGKKYFTMKPFHHGTAKMIPGNYFFVIGNSTIKKEFAIGREKNILVEFIKTNKEY